MDCNRSYKDIYEKTGQGINNRFKKLKLTIYPFFTKSWWSYPYGYNEFEFNS